MLNKDELSLINRIYQDATVGTLAINKVLKKTTNEEMKKLFRKQFDMYEKFADKCEEYAVRNDKEVKENGFFKKMKQTTMLYMSLWADNSNRHIVELMITGTVMGIVDTIKAEKDLKTENEELHAMVAEFKKMQEDFYEKLKKLLAKV